MKIRKATSKDLEEIDKIYVDGSIDEGKLQFPKVSKNEMIKDLERYRKNRLKGFKEKLLSNKNYWVVAIERDKIIGFGQAEIKNYEDDSNYGEVEKVYIKKEFRKKGIARILVKELIGWLKKEGTKAIGARVYSGNNPLIRFFGKMGFKIRAVFIELYSLRSIKALCN